MREIKFRAWDKEDKEYTSWEWLLKRRYNQDYIRDHEDPHGPVLSIHTDKNIELEQFTGLHDKNGKEIYKGDIVFSKDWNPEKQVVTFDRGGFCLKYDGSGYYPDIKYAEQMTVIGNIHENQELLEVTK